ncbi:MAG TPA: hypothetical protein VIX42_08870 [Edaphobacter sp.]
MGNSLFSLVCILLYAFVQTASNGLESKLPRLAGHVLYKDGAPVKDADVEIHFYGPTGAVVPEGRTDDKGYFSIDPPPYGDGVVSASKVSEGYPNAALAFYGRDGYTSIKRVNITPTTVIDSIELRFGDPDATVNFVVQAADTQKAITGARINIAMADQPDIAGSYSVSREGSFQFVLPKNPVSIKITAPGYANWSYGDKSGREQTLLMKPGTQQQIMVLLNRLK